MLPVIIQSKVRIVLTAALVPSYYEVRKKQYIESLSLLSTYGYNNPYIIEAVKKQGPTFLDEYSINVFYATVNNSQAKNHGANECRSFLQGLVHFNFEPDDIIVKLTGRYNLLSDNFIKLIKNNPEHDMFIKPFGYAPGLCSACFAMRYKHLITMLNNLNYTAMDNNTTYLEREIEQYVKAAEKENILKVWYVKSLDLQAHMLGSSNDPSLGDIIWTF